MTTIRQDIERKMGMIRWLGSPEATVGSGAFYERHIAQFYLINMYTSEIEALRQQLNDQNQVTTSGIEEL